MLTVISGFYMHILHNPTSLPSPQDDNAWLATDVVQMEGEAAGYAQLYHNQFILLPNHV